jgi:hypothetical protein
MPKKSSAPRTNPTDRDPREGARDVHQGGCLCGAVRYRVEGPFIDGAHCHCRMCRQASGAVAVTWMTVTLGRFVIEKGKPALYRSSSHAERRFCGRCGTPLTFHSVHEPDMIDVTLGSLDHPEVARPDRHISVSAKIPWLTLDPDLPAHEEDTPASS